MNQLLLEGLADAAGFVAGALAGYLLGLAFGLNMFEPGYGNGAIAAILLASLGGGVGVQLARRWRASRQKDNESR
ncbi:MAG TPA: hypothetical protein VN649_02050 [Ramlibacter sp.]|nr:hypothetical protein [Ramlibacter sp.]